MTEMSEELQKALVDLWRIQSEIQAKSSTKGIIDQAGIEDKIRELLKKAQQIIEKFKPESFSVTAGFPWGANVSFTWSTTKPKV